MGILSGFRKVVSNVINFRVDLWIDYEGLKSTTRFFYRQFKSLYQITPLSRSETFEDAIERLNLTPDLLEIQKKHFSLLTNFFLILAFCFFCYGIWISLTGNLMGCIMSIAISLFALSHAFRYHFWNYQMKRRKLGCTFNEWFNDTLALLKGKNKGRIA